MRVALLCTNFQPHHGWASLAVRLGQALTALGVEVVAVTGQADGEPEDLAPVDVRRVLPPLSRRATAVRLLLANRAVARATADCDLLHILAEPYALACREAARQRPVVLTAAGTFVPLTAGSGPFRRAYQAAYRATTLCAISRFTAAQVARVLPGLEPPVVWPGVRFADYQQPGVAPPVTGPLVVTAGGLKRRKGTQVLVRALARVAAAEPAVQGALLGSNQPDSYAAGTQRLIDELGLRERVHLPGRVSFPELVGWYQAATVFALPSVNTLPSFEGFGLVLLEAQAAGTPVVASRGCGTADAVVEGVTGFLADQDDDAQVAEHLLALLRDPALRERMSRAAREHAARLDWHHVATRYLRLYTDLLGGAGRGG